MAQEQGFFAARIINVENTSGPLLRHLPEGVRALLGHEVASTISYGVTTNAEVVVGLSTSREAALQKGEDQIEHWKKFQPGVKRNDFVIRPRSF